MTNLHIDPAVPPSGLGCADCLATADAVKNADPSLFFPAGVVELKSAWQEVDGALARAQGGAPYGASLAVLLARSGRK